MVSCGCGEQGLASARPLFHRPPPGLDPMLRGSYTVPQGVVLFWARRLSRFAVKCTSHLRASCPVTRREHCRAAYVRHLTRAHRESGSGGHAEPHHRARLSATGSIRRSQRSRTRRNCDAARCRTAALAGIQNSRRRQHRYRNGRKAGARGARRARSRDTVASSGAVVDRASGDSAASPHRRIAAEAEAPDLRLHRRATVCCLVFVLRLSILCS